MKWCNHCQQSKPLTDFYIAAKSADGRQWRCKDCAKASARERYFAAHEKNKEAARDRVWLRNQTPEGRRAKREADARAYRKNPDTWKNGAMRRRARQQSAPIGHFTDRDWQAIIARQHGECFYCGERTTLTKEHLTPLSRGGSHSVGNIVGACTHCNCQKRTKTRMEYRLWLVRRFAAVA